MLTAQANILTHVEVNHIDSFSRLVPALEPTMCSAKAHPQPEDKTWFLVSLRPAGKHAPLRKAVASFGGKLIAASPWRIVYRNDLYARTALTHALSASTLVFTSPEAVIAAHRLIPLQNASRFDHKIWIGIGASTASILEQKGIQQIEFPQQMQSEALIALKSYQRADDIGLITAKGGRDLIAKHALKTGKIVRRADVYERRPIPLRAGARLALTQHAKHLCVAVSSRQAFSLLREQLPPMMDSELLNCPIITTSHRLAQWLLASGFVRIEITSSPQPEQIASTAAQAMTQKQFP